MQEQLNAMEEKTKRQVTASSEHVQREQKRKRPKQHSHRDSYMIIDFETTSYVCELNTNTTACASVCAVSSQ